jgi:acyl-CoA synthetase (AMP-forming)/AMP-acid ligase II
LDHERSKKSRVLDTGSLRCTDFNAVDLLLRQLQDVEVSAMSCPPNILVGVYRMFMNWMSSGGLTEAEACDRVRHLFGNRLANLATGGAPTPSEVLAAVRKWFPRVHFVDSYGTTECGAISANGRVLTEKGVKVKVRIQQGCSGYVGGGVAFGELLVSSPSMSAGYMNDCARSNEAFVRLTPEDQMIFPPATEEDAGLTWYSTGDLVQVTHNEHEGSIVGQHGDWARHISVKGRVSSQVKLSSGFSVSPDALEALYASSDLFSDIYIDARGSSSAVVAIVTPAASLQRIKRPDGSAMFEFDSICPVDVFTSVEGHRNEVGSQFYTRRRQVIFASHCLPLLLQRSPSAVCLLVCAVY